MDIRVSNNCKKGRNSGGERSWANVDSKYQKDGVDHLGSNKK